TAGLPRPPIRNAVWVVPHLVRWAQFQFHIPPLPFPYRSRLSPLVDHVHAHLLQIRVILSRYRQHDPPGPFPPPDDRPPILDRFFFPVAGGITNTIRRNGVRPRLFATLDEHPDMFTHKYQTTPVRVRVGLRDLDLAFGIAEFGPDVQPVLVG